MGYLHLLFYLFISSAHAADRQQELDNLRSRISKMQREMGHTKQSKSRVQDALRASERAISDSNRKIAELTAQKHLAAHNLDTLQARQQNLTDSMQTQQRLLGKQLYLQYIGGNVGYFRQFLNGQEPNQLARNLHYFQYIARERAAGLGTLRGNFSTLQTTQLEVQKHSIELAALNAEELTQRSNLTQGWLAKQQTLENISRQLRQQKREVNRLQRDENRLAQLVKKLAKMLAKPKSNPTFGNTDLPDNFFAVHPFGKLKGKLALPAKGTIRNRFGTPRSDGIVLWKGIFVKSNAGQTVQTIASGRVVFADWLRGFGNLLIVDHGAGYMSLYGNNEMLYKKIGDWATRGEAIASVGNSGGNQESGLYFELRHESKPFDPIPWLAKKYH